MPSTGNLSPFSGWLSAGFNENRGWNEMVTDMLTAEGTLQDNPATAFFYGNKDNNTRQVAANRVVNSVGKLFMGITLSCAECHNHRSARWKRTDYWGVAGFFSQVYDSGAYVAGRVDNTRIVEREGKKSFYYNGGVRHVTVGGGAQIGIPDLEEPEVKTVGAPVKAKFLEGDPPPLGDQGPYRPVFAAWLTAPQNKYFARAAVNRWWAHFFGRGLVHPVADMHEHNLPTHPEVLQLLTAELTASRFDLKHLIRCICNSETYQRTSQPLPKNRADETLLSHMAIKVLSPEALYDSVQIALTGKPPSGNRPDQFIKLFTVKEAGEDPTEFSFALPQFLSLMNQYTNTTPRIFQTVYKPGDRPEKTIEAIYLTVLSRPPLPAESKRVSRYVSKPAEYGDLIWALVNSAEFMLNH